jgi:phosphatidylethanolamine/phosphatidyl-N-methylethanolamine N-methyltransferase
MAAADIRLFLAGWLRSPLQVGALVPSSDALARCMAAQVDPSQPGLVVELGPGTGTVTRALLARGLPPEALVIVERDANFCHLLRNRFPGVRVLHADAKSLSLILDKEGLPPPRAVISSLPLLSLDFASQRKILRQSIEVLAAKGSFVQFTYGFRSPVHPVLQRRLRLQGEPVARILRNLPPAMIWRYTQARAG